MYNFDLRMYISFSNFYSEEQWYVVPVFLNTFFNYSNLQLFTEFLYFSLSNIFVKSSSMFTLPFFRSVLKTIKI